MTSSFHKCRPHVTGDTPRQEKWRMFSLLSTCNPFKKSNLFFKRENTFNLEKIGLSVKEEAPLSEADYERGDTVMSGPVRAEPYHWPHDGRFEPATTALVIVDMQRDFCENGGYMAYQGYDITPAKNVIPVIRSILEKFREAGYPIYFTREGHRPDLSTLSTREQYRSRNNKENLGIGDPGPLGRLLIRGQPGHNIIPELEPLENEPVIDKPGRGAFAHTEFGLMLSIKGIQNLIICGVTTDVCVTSTLREANDRRFDCILVSDACAAGDAALHDAAVQTIKEEGGIFGTVTTTEELLRALKETAKKSVEESRRVQRPYTTQETFTSSNPQETTSRVPLNDQPSADQLVSTNQFLAGSSSMLLDTSKVFVNGNGHGADDIQAYISPSSTSISERKTQPHENAEYTPSETFPNKMNQSSADNHLGDQSGTELLEPSVLIQAPFVSAFAQLRKTESNDSTPPASLNERLFRSNPWKTHIS